MNNLLDEQLGGTTTTQFRYAGFWLRFVAVLIDGIILAIVGGIVGLLYGVAVVLPDGDLSEADRIGADIIGAIIGILYDVVMTASPTKGTLGKMAVRIQVVDKNGNGLSMGRVFLRYLGKILSALILGIGYIMAGVTEKKQALHDMMLDCYVVKKD